MDEEYDEKLVLLQEITDLLEEEQASAREKKDTKTKEEEAAKDIRKRALEGMKKGKFH